MKKIIAYIILLISLLANTTVSMAQETRVTGTLKVHPWLNLPVVISTDIKGGLQSYGSTPVDFTGKTISATLNAVFPIFKREIGMVSTVVDATTNKTRYFEYSASDTWREIFVIYGWEAGRAYAIGDYVAYNGNFYVANAIISPSPFDATKWDNAGGKDGKYTIKEMKMDGQTLNKVAISTSVVTAGTEDNTLVTAGYALNAPFDGKRAVTRPNWNGVSGENFNTSTIAEFLNKVFFPARSPYVDYFRFQNQGGHLTPPASYEVLTDALAQKITPYEGTVTVLYADWSPLPNFTFNYNITKQDPAVPIVKVELFNGSDVAPLLTNLGDNVTGSFVIPKSKNYTKLTIKITDASNSRSLALNTVFKNLLGVTISSTYVSTTAGGSLYNPGLGSGTASDPYLIERVGTDINLFLRWGYTMNNDNTVTDIAYSGTPSLTNPLANGSYNSKTSESVTFTNSNPATIYRMGVSAQGDVGLAFSSPPVYSAYYQLRDKIYCGYLPPLSGDPTESQIFGLQESSLLASKYFSSIDHSVSPPVNGNGGIELTNNLGIEAYFTWAVPTYVSASDPKPTSFQKYTYVDNGGFWAPNEEGFDRTSYFVKTTGANATWYWVTVYNASVKATFKTKAILQN